MCRGCCSLHCPHPTRLVLRRSELSQKTDTDFHKSLVKCFLFPSLLLPALVTWVLQQPRSTGPFTAGCCFLQAGWGSWPQHGRMSPQTAERQWLPGGTCSSSQCLLSAIAPLPVRTQTAGPVRTCSGYAGPTQDVLIGLNVCLSCRSSNLHPSPYAGLFHSPSLSWERPFQLQERGPGSAHLWKAGW